MLERKWKGKVNLSEEVVRFHKRFKEIPKPFFVVRCGDHFMVCTLDKDFNLIDEVSCIHWNVWTVRRWAFDFAKEQREGGGDDKTT